MKGIKLKIMKQYGYFNLYNSYTASDLEYPLSTKLSNRDREEIRKELRSISKFEKSGHAYYSSGKNRPFEDFSDIYKVRDKASQSQNYE